MPAEHCPEHEERTRMLIEDRQCIIAMKRERDSQFAQMKKSEDLIYTKLDNLESGKVSMGLFKWILSAIGAVAVLILGMLLNVSSEVSALATDMQVLTAETKAEARAEARQHRREEFERRQRD